MVLNYMLRVTGRGQTRAPEVIAPLVSFFFLINAVSLNFDC